MSIQWRLPTSMFGARVDYLLGNRASYEHLEYYLRPHVLDGVFGGADPAVLSVALRNSGGLPFQEALTWLHVEKRIYVSLAGSRHFELHDRFTAHPTAPNVLPPLRLMSRPDSRRSFHAAAAALPGDADFCVVLRGSSGSGKSTLLLHLLLAGLHFVADDILVLDLVTGRAMPYGRPIGVRPHAAAVLAEARADIFEEAVRGSVAVPSKTGTTLMLRPEALGFTLRQGSVAHGLTVRLTRGDPFALRPVASDQVDLTWLPERDARRAIDSICALLPPEIPGPQRL